MREVAELELLRKKHFYDGIASPQWRRKRLLETKEMLNNPPPVEPDDAA
jgi:hypothetical protein